MQVGRPARRALVLVVLATCLGGAALAQLPELPEPSEHSYSGADCYGCHKVWSPIPLRSMFALRPMETEPVAVGTVMELGVEVQQTWVAATPGWPKLTHFEGTVDIANAPSLGFVSQLPPVLGVQTHGSIDPTDNPINDAYGDALMSVPSGTSELIVTVSPNSTDPLLGPDIAFRLHPDRIRPGSSPWRNLTVDDGGRGEPEVLVIRGNSNISELGSTPFAVEAILRPTSDAGGVTDVQLEPRRVDFTVTVDAYRNTTGETTQVVIVDRTVEPGGTTIIPFDLLATQLPAAGESVVVYMNATAYYPHDTGGGKDDFGNISKATRIQVLVVGDKVTFGQEAVAVDAVAATLQLDRISEIVGYVSAFLLVSSIVSGGIFGASSRRAVNKLFHGARRRIAFHNFLSYGILLAAAVHTVLFIIETNYEWTLGIIWGSIAILCMLGLGATGAWQVHMIRRWNFPVWRWTHFGLSIGAIVFTIVHMLLDGANFGFVQDAVGWDNPFPDPRETAAGSVAGNGTA